MKKLTSLMIIMSFVFLSVSLASTADIPMMLNYQGYVEDSFGGPVNGNGYFKFAIVNDPNGTITYWSNDVGDDPNAVTIPVTDGFFSIKLGDTKISYMSALPPSVFDQQNIFVRVWFSTDNETFDLLSKDTQIVSSGFAYKAQSVVSGHALDAADGDPVDAVYVDNEGNVGIGITGPPYSLQVAPGGGAARATGAGLGIGWNKIFGRGETDFYNYGQYGSGGFSFWNYPTPGPSYPTTGETHLMSITSTGNVGIGTDTPNTLLHLNSKETTSTLLQMTTSISGSSDEDGLRVGMIKNEASIWNYETGNLVFGTNNAASMLISNIGCVAIGTTYSTLYKLYVTGSAFSTGGWSSASDERWKRNITPYEESLDKVNQLQGVSYEWKVDEYPDQGFTEGKQIGLIAQDVEKLIPEIVQTNDDGYKSVSYEKLTVVLVEAIKAQQSQIEELRAQNEALQTRIEALEEW